MTVHLDPNVPSYSGLDCQFQIVQLLEHKKEVKLVLDLGTMFGAFAVGFAKTLPKAKVLAVDFWQGENSGIEDMENSQHNCRQYTDLYPNIETLNLDYTHLPSLAQLPKNPDFVYIGGPIPKNCFELISHFDATTLIAGVRYVVTGAVPVVSYSQNCKSQPDRVLLKEQLVATAKKLNRDLLPFGCYNWMMPPTQQRRSLNG